MRDLLRDLRLAARELRRRASASVVTMSVLALGLGSAVAVFSVVDAFLLRPLGIADIARVVRVREVLPGQGGPGATVSLSPATFALWRQAESPLEAIAAATGRAANLTGHGDPLRLRAALVTANFFEVLGVQPILGRAFAPGEDQAGRDGVVLLGYGLWQRVFGGRPDVLGTAIMLDGSPKTVVGVMPRGFRHPYEGEIWEPLVLGAAVHRRGNHYLYAPARLKPGVSLAEARQELNRLAEQARASYPGLTAAVGADVTPLRREILGNVQPVLYVLLAGSLVVLVIALVNVTNLIVAQHLLNARGAEIRMALGARFRDLFALSFLRHLLLLGGAVGVALPVISVGASRLVGLSGVSAVNEFDTEARLDPTTIAVVVGATLGIAIVLALLDTLRVQAHGAGGPSIGSTRSVTAGRATRRGMRALVLSQFVASLLLLTAGFAMGRGYYRLMHHERGFAPDHVLTADIAFPQRTYPDAASRARLVNTALVGLRQLPGVVSAGASSVTPDFPGTWGATYVAAGVEPPDPPGYFVTNHRIVTPGYFAAMRIPVLQGRPITEADQDETRRTVVVSRAFADRLWPNENPIGNRVRTWNGGAVGSWMTIVGVVGNVEEAALGGADLDMRSAWYIPCAQRCDAPGMTFTLRTQNAPPDLGRRVAAVIHRADPDLAVFRVVTMGTRLTETFDRELLTAILLGVFALAGVAIAIAGIYAVASISVAARYREIGIRVALGAEPRRVALTLVLEHLRLFALGLAVAVPILWMAQRWMAAGLSPMGGASAAVLVAAPLTLTLLSCLALLAPVLLILRVNPIRVLQEE